MDIVEFRGQSGNVVLVNKDAIECIDMRTQNPDRFAIYFRGNTGDHLVISNTIEEIRSILGVKDLEQRQKEAEWAH